MGKSLRQVSEPEGSLLKRLKTGADIYGIDFSPSMLTVLNSKLSAEQKKRVSLQNIVDFKSK